MKESKLLENIIKEIPKFKCIEGCTDCCGPVFTTKTEAETLGIEVGLLTNSTGSGKCQFVSECGCSVYESRPVMCRMFGSSDILELRCRHGKSPSKRLSADKSNSLIHKYRQFVIMDLNKINAQLPSKQS